MVYCDAVKFTASPMSKLRLSDMSDIKIIFFDIDGTLLDPEVGRITDKHKQTLHQLQERGI